MVNSIINHDIIILLLEVFNSIGKKMINIDIENLIQELVQASQAYYNSEPLLMSDEEFDAKQFILVECSKKNEYGEYFKPGSLGYSLLDKDLNLGAEVIIDNPVPHTFPMLSLGKAKTEEELKAYIKRVSKYGVKEFNLEPKIDGMSLSAIYSQGKIKQLASKGKSNIGENLNYLIHNKDFTLQYLPSQLPVKDDLVIRGEIYLTQEQFEKVNQYQEKLYGEPFKNSRNALAGLVKRAKLGLHYPVEATLASYIYILNNRLEEMPVSVSNVLYTPLNLLDSSYRGINSLAQLYSKIKEFGALRADLDYPTDGIVIKPAETAKFYELMGINSHHPLSQIAWKYPAEKKTTKILKITNTIGRTGKVTPVAEIETVVLDGSHVSYVSLHNYAIIKELNLNISDTVIVEKANDIIPKIVSVLQKNSIGSIEAPTHCPICNEQLSYANILDKYRNIYCSNSECASKERNAIIYAVKKDILNIDGLSESTIDALIENGLIKNFTDLYTLTEETLENLKIGTTSKNENILYGKKRAQKIIKNLEESKKLPLHKVLPALNITSLGKTNSKELVKYFPTLKTLKSPSIIEIQSIDGFGLITAKNIVEGLALKIHQLELLEKYGFNFNTISTNQQDSQSLQNLNFSISGTVPEKFNNRNELIDYIEQNGGTFNTTPNKNTTYLIGDKNDNSSKIKKAIQLNITIISPTEFLDKFCKEIS